MTNYGTVIDNTLHPAPRAFMLHGAMATQRDILLQTACIPFSIRTHSPFKIAAISQS